MIRADARERSELVSIARELVPLLTANAPENERQGSVTPEVDAALRTAGFYTLTAPRKFGGREAGARTLIEVFAELARGCGASAWVGKIHCGSAFLASMFDDRARQDIWGEDGHAAVTASLNGSDLNTAQATKHGITVSGEWHYASGVHEAQWVVCKVSVGNRSTQQTDTRLALIPAPDITIKSTWDMAGMEGTGSDSFTVRDLFVPQYRTIPLALALDGSTRSPQELETVYQTSVLAVLGTSIAGPVIGMARGALEHVLSTLETGRPLTGSVYTDAVDSPSVQLAVADVASLIDTAQLHAYRAADDIEAASAHGHPLDLATRARIRMDTGVVMLRCREAIERLLDLGGSSSFTRSNPLQRFWRNLTVASRHALVSPLLNREIYGRALLDQEQVTEIV